MKKFVLVFAAGMLSVSQGYAQSASATWSLTADTIAVCAGNVAAANQILTDTMSVKDYQGGTQTTGSPVGAAERVWRSNLSWPTETGQNNTRYVQYAVAPSSGNTLTVQSVGLNIGCFGTTSHFFANVYCSTDPTFATNTLLNPSVLTLPDIRTTAMAALSYSLNVFVDTGKTFYVRIYPWFDGAPSASKYVCITDVAIAGSTVLIGAPTINVFPNSFTFGNVHVGSSSVKSYALSGMYLDPGSGSIAVTASSPFQVSTNEGSGFSSSIDLPYTAGVLGSTTVYVRFSPTSTSAYGGIIANEGGSATADSVSVGGTGVPADTILGVFVSPAGSDTNAGTFEKPFRTISKAIATVELGDTIFVRAGTYSLNTTVTISPSGTPSNFYCLTGYPGDGSRPVLDFSAMSFGSSNRGIVLSGNFWHIKGLEITRAGDNGMYITGSDNIVEFCSLHDNRDAGMQLGGGASNNRIVNCDAYFNYDDSSSTPGGNADGFAPKLTVGTGNSFYGCRSWQNSDDGWDGYLSTSNDVTTTLENCWSFQNGYLQDGVTTNSNMNGNGFKMGGSSAGNLLHNVVLKDCLAFMNKAKGFDQNHTRGSITLLNCTADHNGLGGDSYNFSVPDTLATSAGKVLTVENCISFSPTKAPGYSLVPSPAVVLTNSWMSPFAAPAAADFVSIDTSGVRGPRKADGSLPDIEFIHLAQGSQFIDAGTVVGLPYNGTKPDLGCFESGGPVNVEADKTLRVTGFKVFQNYPNPFNPATVISFTVEKKGLVVLRVYNVLGQLVEELYRGAADAGTVHQVVFDAKGLPSGIYFSSIEYDGQRIINRMALIK
jgi:hypothetical protein